MMALIAESQRFGNDGGEEEVIAKSMSEADVATLVAWSQTNLSSDGTLNGHIRAEPARSRAFFAGTCAS